MTSFRYNGPVSAVTLRRPDGGTEEVPLHPGATVTLPGGAPYVATLMALGRLTEVPPAAPPETAPPETAPSEIAPSEIAPPPAPPPAPWTPEAS